MSSLSTEPVSKRPRDYIGGVVRAWLVKQTGGCGCMMDR